MTTNNLCLGCMNTLTNPRAACPHCGWSRRTSQNHLQQLPQGITLTNPTNGKQYLIGKTVGQGGFGIVYTAWDVAGNRKVAVKEYFPNHFVTRDRSNTIVLTSDSQSNQEFFDKQKKRFRQEAEKMQLFADSPNVVTVRDFFDANNTSYIVMEFVEGQTLDQILNGPIAKNHRLSLQTVLLNLKQIVAILEQMHHTPWTDDNGKIHQGIIHRDISPENIMYASDGTVKLINFGAPRFTIHYTQELKPDCAPCEQYFSFGDAAKQGSWTDVYAFAATIYYAITGQFPANSLVRALDRDNTNVDPLVLPSAFGIQITPAQEQILLNGLALDYHNRYQSVSQFYNDLVNAGKVVPVLTVSAFNKNGNNYTATINYNGDGMLSSSVGTINGNILSVVSTDGNFNGVITASEGQNYLAALIPFNHEHIQNMHKILHEGLAASNSGKVALKTELNGNGESDDGKSNDDKSGKWKSLKKIIALIFIGVLVTLSYPFISARVHNEKGVEYLNEQQYDKALEEFNQAIKLYSSSSLIYFNRGATYLGKKNYDQAIADFDKAIELSPKNAIAYNDRGLAYFYKGNREQAIKDCKKAVELDPKNELYKRNLDKLLNYYDENNDSEFSKPLPSPR